MNFLSLLRVEFKKIRHTKILFIFLAATIILWLPSIVNVHLNFEMRADGISPEHNFFIQGFLAMTWFMFPACMVVCTVLLNQVENSGNGMAKMLSLPIHTFLLCLAKFTVLISLAAIQLLLAAGMYFISAAIVSQTQGYHFLLSPLFVMKETGNIFLSSLPMLSFFWMVSVCIRTPVFAVGIGFASIVPSVLMINTSIWFAYPMCYPFYIITSEYARLTSSLSTSLVSLFPWLPAALGITMICFTISCLCFGRAERR